MTLEFLVADYQSSRFAISLDEIIWRTIRFMFA